MYVHLPQFDHKMQFILINMATIKIKNPEYVEGESNKWITLSTLIKSEADEIITKEGDGTKYLADDGTYKEVITDIPSDLLSSKQDKNLYFTNVSASSWVADSTYQDFGYRCDVVCSGVTVDCYAEVVFDFEQAVSGNYAPICETGTDTVSIWSRVNDGITVPTIIITR